MENSNKKKQFIFSLIGIMVLILFSVGMVYAFFNYSKTGTRNNVITTTNLNISFEDSSWIWLENAYPLKTEQALLLEVGGSSDIIEVDGGLAQFKVSGSNANGTIHYFISLDKEDLTSVTTSEHGTYTLDPSTKIGQLPDGAVNINLQTSTSDIFEDTGLVNNTSNLLYPGRSFSPSASGGYINTENSINISSLPLVSGSQTERTLGTGTISGNAGTRYFELRMWINDTVMINDDLRPTCLSGTSTANVNTYGYGYCNPSTNGLPRGIKYVYSSGEFAKLYYSNRIKIETTDVTNGVEEVITPEITTSLTAASTPIDDSEFSNLYSTVVGSADTGLLLMSSTANDAYPIYYYRGPVTNNNVLFAGKCWKIIRTTETGGTKIIYTKTPSNGDCSGNLSAYNNWREFNTRSNDISNTNFMNSINSSSFTMESKYASSIFNGGSIVWGNDVKYQNGTYTLLDTVQTSGIESSLYTRHYSCFTNGTTCSSVKYVFKLTSGSSYYYTLYGGLTADTFYDFMINPQNNPSPSKALETLYEFYTSTILNNYDSYLEDTVFCNDHSLAYPSSFELNNSNSGNWDSSVNGNPGDLRFGAFKRLTVDFQPSLACPREEDKYTVSETLGNGKLQYPVGLITADELAFAGAKYNANGGNMYLKNSSSSGYRLWTMTPSRYGYNGDNEIALFTFYPSNTGSLGITDANDQEAIHPVVSLAPDVRISGGDGSASNPYTVTK